MKWGEDALQSGLQMLFKCRQIKETLKTHLHGIQQWKHELRASMPKFGPLGEQSLQLI